MINVLTFYLMYIDECVHVQQGAHQLTARKCAQPSNNACLNAQHTAPPHQSLTEDNVISD